MKKSLIIARNTELCEKRGRLANKKYRVREHLKECEVVDMVRAAKNNGFHRTRNAAIITALYHHAMRLGELIKLEWANIDFEGDLVMFDRLKGSKSAHHELRPTLRKLLLKLKRDSLSKYVFENSRGTKLTPSTVQKLIGKLGKQAELDIKVHPHMLRHSMGYFMINQPGANLRLIQNHLGHVEISHTVRYTDLDEQTTKGLFDNLKC